MKKGMGITTQSGKYRQDGLLCVQSMLVMYYYMQISL